MPEIESAEKRLGLHLACFTRTVVESKRNSPAPTVKTASKCESRAKSDFLNCGLDNMRQAVPRSEDKLSQGGGPLKPTTYRLRNPLQILDYTADGDCKPEFGCKWLIIDALAGEARHLSW